MAGSVGGTAPSRATAARLRAAAYGFFFLSGATSLIFEILWSRQFVTVFGNSSYAISIVLCAFMAGLGLGGWLGGRLADRFRDRLLLYGALQAAVALLALGVPLALALLRQVAPSIAMLAPRSAALTHLVRFAASFAVLVFPCTLMGATLPLLSRFCVDSPEAIGKRVGLLYGVNTLGAAAGCLAAGYWMIDSLGLSLTNQLAVGANLVTAGAIALLVGWWRRAAAAGARAPVVPQPAQSTPDASSPNEVEDAAHRANGLLLGVAFVSGLAGLASEVLWVRYLAFLDNAAYLFPAILGIYLLGTGLGSIVYRLVLARRGRPILLLAGAELLLGLAVPACFVVSAAVFSSGPPDSPGVWPMTVLTVLVPTALMGMAFPLICAAYARRVATAGRRIGAVYALNTLGAIAGSLIPVFLLIPALGIQASIMLAGGLYWLLGLALLWAGVGRRRLPALAAAGAATALLVAVALLGVPRDLCRRVFLWTSPDLARHDEVLFYREGRTGTSVVVRDLVNGLKRVYINGTGEVPTTFSAMSCFKFMGGLGPLLHPEPDDVLMICFGGGIAGGATIQHPDVKSLELVDLESSIVEAARLLERENNGILRSPKVSVTIDDGRNYILTARRRWPVIICDSTHPKSSDSWVLYTREFYRTVRAHLADDGVFVQWVPFHNLTVSEYKIIVRTFQSVFPHASLWFSHGVDETGQYVGYSLLAATMRPLGIDVRQLERKLSAPAVADDLRPWGLDTSVGILESFICAEEALRGWVGEGPVNTDDLPYTQYTTSHSRGPQCVLSSFVPAMESVWPYLTGQGDGEEAAQLWRDLDMHARANKLMFTERKELAFSLLPEAPKLARYAENLGLGRQYVEQVAGYYPDVPSALMWLADLAISRPDPPDQAISLWRQVLQVAPENVRALNSLSIALSEVGLPDEAIRYCRRALEVDPDLPEAHVTLGMELAHEGKADEAIGHYRKALRCDPDSVKAHNNLGIALAARGESAQALAHYERALSIDPYFAPAWANLGGLLADLGRPAEAMGDLREALYLDPFLPVGHHNMGVLLARQGDLGRAAAHFRAALWAEPDYAHAHFHLAQALLQQGQLDEAIAHFSAACEIDPRFTEARRGLAAAMQLRSRGGSGGPATP